MSEDHLVRVTLPCGHGRTITKTLAAICERYKQTIVCPTCTAPNDDSPTCPHRPSSPDLIFDGVMGLWVHQACGRPTAEHLRRVAHADGGFF